MAEDALTEWCWPWVFQQLHHAFPCTNQEIVADGVTDALRDYLKRPHRFDPARASLGTFLFLAAWRNVRDLDRDEKRRQCREEPVPDEVVDQLLDARVNGDGFPRLTNSAAPCPP